MPDYSIDILYASARLGLEPGASLGEVQKTRANAAAYRFSTKARVREVERLAAFFEAREQFGSIDRSFADIRKAYYKKAMSLHPDRNEGSREAEDHLKAVNASFELIEAIHREAKGYFRQDEDARRESEVDARQMRDKETPGEKKKATREAKTTTVKTPAASRYMAASVPRFLRQSRLGYLPLDCIIGSRITRGTKGQNLIFDIIMLPAREFQRMRNYIGLQHIATPELKMGPSFQPAFVPTDAKSVTVPVGETDPAAYAREHFLLEFGLIVPERD